MDDLPVAFRLDEGVITLDGDTRFEAEKQLRGTPNVFRCARYIARGRGCDRGLENHEASHSKKSMIEGCDLSAFLDCSGGYVGKEE